ncbi:hypothetical protein O7598_15440 [Micromonospora sp. WMMC241]|uniref:Uncharacterized protein n=1 Tax=Micromonospora humi TaxID=745366 RepID=A0A1C5H6V0_9ACTN|nr:MULTISPECIES: hypothetical protein [Micromonospora]MCZ7437801.1 hypothetical protein [Micromonospora sp. WMMC241]SCG41710.1 hypothetical protein GA0070213_102366 [Micromonospora humi]
MSAGGEDRSARRRKRLLLAGLLAVVGLILLLLGLTVANGAVAGVEVVLALLLLVASYAIQRVARRETVYRDEGRR